MVGSPRKCVLELFEDGRVRVLFKNVDWMVEWLCWFVCCLFGGGCKDVIGCLMRCRVLIVLMLNAMQKAPDDGSEAPVNIVLVHPTTSLV